MADPTCSQPLDACCTTTCPSGTVPDICKAAGIACATSKTTPTHQTISPTHLEIRAPTDHKPASLDSNTSPTQLTPQPPRPTRPPHRRIPHTLIERKYRDNLNTQIESLRLSLPSLANAYASSPPDVEDAALPAKWPSKAMIISAATGYIKDLTAERDRALASVADLQMQVSGLMKLVSCEECEVLRYLRAVEGAGESVVVG